MQPECLNTSNRNLKLDQIVHAVIDGDDPILFKKVISAEKKTYKHNIFNIYKIISGIIFLQLRKVAKPLKISILVFLGISIIVHSLVIEGVYRASQNKVDEVKKENPEKVKLRITPTVEQQMSSEAIESKPALEVKNEEAPAQAPNKQEPEFKQLSSEQLVELGQEHMEMVKEGTFPALILTYRSPISYIEKMYALGAKTVVYDTVNREYYEINLLKGGILPLSNNDFKGYSLIKRVIKDAQWNPRKASAASRLKASPEHLEILLLLPMTLEARWVGHQVSLLRQMKIKISEAQTIEAQFQDAKFKLLRVHLKDGSSKDINDNGCA